MYLGQEAKIMMNAKKPPRKVSQVMIMMNYMLYSIFVFQFVLIFIFACASVGWTNEKGKDYTYLDQSGDRATFGDWIIQLLTYWVAYSHLIPISLYVMIEVLKLTQASFIKWDIDIGAAEIDGEKPAECKNSDLIEELGQVDFIFTDKTGTLTLNQMEFKNCSVEGKIFIEKSSNENDIKEMYNSRSHFKNSIDKDDELMDMTYYWNEEYENNDKLYDFFKFMAICHSVRVDKKSKDKEESKSEVVECDYQCSSPDELALVLASKKVGIVLADRTKENLIIQEEGPPKEYKMHAEFKFDSDRKRMSVVFEDNGEYYLYTKGADNKMVTQIDWSNDEQKETVDKHLQIFAVKGLRTLVMGKKKITKQTFDDIIEGIQNIQSSESTDKDAQFTALYQKHETNLIYVGASAIEDKLQDQVPATIAKLMESNIRLWVLTGDKQETAIEIAKSCQLIQDGMEVITLTLPMKEIKIQAGENEEEFKRRKINTELEYKKKLVENIENYKKDQVDPFVKFKDEDDIFARPFKDLVKSGCQITVVIDGPTLALILGDESLERKFLSIGLYSKSVVCCRVSPKQKSLVVGLAKKYKKGCIRLAIGDGANDVPMIMEANIGVGIRGKEGTQAVRSSDYAISQFKYLQKLILYHGRLGYRRVSWVICYYFYKNIVLVLTELYFAFYNGFSGQIYFADWLPMLYNSLWTSLTCLFAYALERDVTYAITLKNPQLYEAGQKKQYFSYLIFWKWVGLAFFHGFVTFFGVTYGFSGAVDNSGKTEDMWFISTVAFSCIIHLVTGKLAIELIFLNWVVLVAGIVSVVFYWLFVIVFNTSPIAQAFQPELEYIYFRLFGNFQAWLAIFLIPLICLLPDMTIKYFQQLYNPTISDDVVKKNYKKSSNVFEDCRK